MLLKVKRTQEIGVPLALADISAIMICMIKVNTPDIFLKAAKDGSFFRCSDSFVRKFLRLNHWSRRKPTKAAQKLPDDVQDQCRKSFFRQVLTIRNDGVKAYLRANSDQTQSPYAQGTGSTWNESGVKQVAVVGAEEKRAFTLMVGVTASGYVLPFQAIYKGKTILSLPVKAKSDRNSWTRAHELDFCFEPSGTETYWSTITTMKSYVDNILAPYFTRARADHGDPLDQTAIWRIDAWSVHRHSRICRRRTGFVWAELSKFTSTAQPPSRGEPPPDDDVEREFDDDLAMPSSVLRDQMFSSKTAGTGFVENEAGEMMPMSISKTLEDDAADSDHEFAIPSGADISASVDELAAAAGSEPVEMGCGKQLKWQNQLYSDENLKFWEA
ncbi:hypothetical protein EWM64_g6135 [Hericium alpestre]|uniref:DDE-1 domain-containing protein n=1 Tax=Hericium alpestre TaxID=135208 RepID=A0A4Y9ZWL1_9AGAM|nr:hypothetical protein EWM64_g6135 [Hericium alpestre]